MISFLHFVILIYFLQVTLCMRIFFRRTIRRSLLRMLYNVGICGARPLTWNRLCPARLHGLMHRLTRLLWRCGTAFFMLILRSPTSCITCLCSSDNALLADGLCPIIQKLPRMATLIDYSFLLSLYQFLISFLYL